jgi:ligand-binding sensor domain-containing protein
MVPAAAGAGCDWQGEVNALCADPEGMWIGTPSGAAHVKSGACTWLRARNGLVYDNVRAIERDADGRMWFGTTGGISVWDGTTFRNYTERDGLPSQIVHTLRARRDEMFVGTDNSMLRFHGGAFDVLDDDKMGLEFESMRTIVRYKADSLALGTSNGLAFVDGKTGFNDDDLYGDAVNAIGVAPNAEVWVGTNLRGLYHRGRDGWENIRTPQGLPSNRISAILVDRKGAIWIGTADAGLARIAPPGAALKRAGATGK